VPMLVAGDEFGRTQMGNNNAWCQDNEISWINWELLDKNRAQFDFFKKLIRLRKEHQVFRRDDFFITAHTDDDPTLLLEISWQGMELGKKDWSETNQTLAFILNGSLLEEKDDDFFIMLNGHREKPQSFMIPKPPTSQQHSTWVKIIDTSLEAPHDFMSAKSAQPTSLEAPHDFMSAKSAQPIAADGKLIVEPMGCIVLQSKNSSEA